MINIHWKPPNYYPSCIKIYPFGKYKGLLKQDQTNLRPVNQAKMDSSQDSKSSGLFEGKDNDVLSAKNKTNKASCATGEACKGTEQSEIEVLINGISSDPQEQHQPIVVTPEMLYKLSKKIAQLTKVIRVKIIRPSNPNINIPTISLNIWNNIFLLNWGDIFFEHSQWWSWVRFGEHQRCLRRASPNMSRSARAHVLKCKTTEIQQLSSGWSEQRKWFESPKC